MYLEVRLFIESSEPHGHMNVGSGRQVARLAVK